MSAPEPKPQFALMGRHSGQKQPPRPAFLSGSLHSLRCRPDPGCPRQLLAGFQMVLCFFKHFDLVLLKGLSK
jgi:hypothetical protein